MPRAAHVRLSAARLTPAVRRPDMGCRARRETGAENGRRHLRLLSSIMRSAQQDRLIAASPCDGVRLPRHEGAMVDPLTVGQVETLAEAITPALRGAVLFAALTGVRQGEMFGMTEDRVLWLRREIRVDRQLLDLGAGTPTLGPTKTSRSVRTVPLSDRALEVLSEQVRTYGTGEGFIFHFKGKPWKRNTAGAAMRQARKATGFDAGWHALRHHCASVLIAEGLGVTGSRPFWATPLPSACGPTRRGGRARTTPSAPPSKGPGREPPCHPRVTPTPTAEHHPCSERINTGRPPEPHHLTSSLAVPACQA